MSYGRRHLAAAWIACCLLVTTARPAYAANSSAFLSGSVTSKGVPIANALVSASGNNSVVTTKTDAKGHFAFSPLPLGTYQVEASYSDLRGGITVDLGSGGNSIAIALVPLTEIGHTVVSRAQAEILHGSGSDVVLNSAALTQLPFDNSFSEMEIQMPGAVRGANGVVHINGDHGVINYMIDGVPLPQELNRDIGGEINLNDLSFIDLVEGAYPAQYGMRFGSVFNMSTRAGTGAPGVDGYASFGSYTNAQSQIGFHGPIAGGGASTSRSATINPRADSIRRTSTRRITTQARSANLRALPSPAAEATLPISRLSTATARFRFRTTLQTANPPRPTTTRRKPIRS